MPRFLRIAHKWAVRCFGIEHVSNVGSRSLRTGEEAIELMQCGGVSRALAHQLVDSVYDRPIGSMCQEIGGVLLTTTVLCAALGLDPDQLLETELCRVLTR